jgi:hypothetical protein
VSGIRSEALDYVGDPVLAGIAQCDQKSAGVRGTRVILPAPGVDVNVAVRVDDDVSRVSYGVGEDSGAESGRQSDAAVITAARVAG